MVTAARSSRRLENRVRQVTYAVPSVRPLDPIAFAERMQQSGPKGLVVSVSHDCYVKIIGGTQIFIADEQRRFAQCGCSYLHISPLQPRLSFADPDPDFQVQVVFDREFLGTGKATGFDLIR